MNKIITYKPIVLIGKNYLDLSRDKWTMNNKTSENPLKNMMRDVQPSSN